MDTSKLPFKKPEPRKRVKARARRAETRVKSGVREQVMLRDGHRCRLAGWPVAQALLGVCRGPVEWAHWGEYRRSKTRGQEPERRHCREGGLALCDGHHDAYDLNEIDILALTPDKCNGRLRFVKGDVAWEEPI